MEVFRRVLFWGPRTGMGSPLLLRGDGTTPVSQLPLTGSPTSNGDLYRGTEQLLPGADLQSLLPGEVLASGGPAPSPRITNRTDRLELRVVGGPSAGRVLPLSSGRSVIGRAGADLPIDDPFVSRAHADLEIDGQQVIVSDRGSANGSWLRGARLTQPTDLPLGEVLRVGDSLAAVVHAARPELQLVEVQPGALGVNRRFRSGVEPLPAEVRFPSAPQDRERPGLNLLYVLAPAAAALVLALVTRQVLILLFMALGPLLGLGTSVSRRRSFDREQASERREYESAVTAARALLDSVRSQEAARLRSAEPDPAAAVQCARASGRLLWARREADADFLSLRVGSGSKRSAVRVAGADDPDPYLWQVPVSVSLRRAGSLGIIGDLDRARALARSLVLQAAVFHAPTELKIVLLGADRLEAEWGWLRWLPHCRWSQDENFVLVGTDHVSGALRLGELDNLLKRRKEAERDRRDTSFLPAVLVVADEVTRAQMDALAPLLRDGPRHGIHLICLDRATVPQGCNASVQISPDLDATVVEQAGLPVHEDVLVDGVQPGIADRAARCLAPLRLMGEEAATELPQQVRLLDLLDMPVPGPEAVLQRWAAVSRRAEALVGVGEGGGPFLLDLTTDGPHGVVAGTSRSGKSEFLKTMIAALAAQNHPDDLSFVFIDFKGGNDYGVAARLPHTVDLSTNLDPSGFDRSLRLLDAEIVRRTRLAATLGASTLEAYWSAQDLAGRTTPKLGRLVVVVDEFAELAQRSPEQLDRLVSVARVGAAYGVHLILATQRPAGVVSGQIDANTPLRVCFRTTKPEHSVEVLGVPDAGDIAERHRGRGIVRVHSAPPVEMQCARVGGARPGAAADVRPPRVEKDDWSRIGHLPPPETVRGEVPDELTDFHDLAVALREAATRTGWRGNAVPWPKPLPTLVTPEMVIATERPERAQVPVGLADDPVHQQHRPVWVGLGEGHVAVAGSPSTGRTTILRSFAAALVEQVHCDEAHLFVLDLPGGGLGGLTALPHCAGVASADMALAERLLERLEGEADARRTVFEQLGVSTLPEHNATAPSALPWLVLLVDGYEILHEESQTPAGSVLLDRLQRLLSEGRRFGLQAVLAGDRWVASGRLGRLVTHRLALRFNEVGDYDTVGISSRTVPAAMAPGRALDVSGRQIQLAALGDGSGAAQARALQDVAQRVRLRDAGRPQPPRTRALPSVVSLEEALPAELAGYRLPVTVGLSAASSQAVVLDLAVEPRGLVVAGRRRCGRSTALLAMGLTALKAGVPVVAMVPKPSPLGLIAEHGARVVRPGESLGLPEDGVLLLVDDADVIDRNDPELMSACARPGVAPVVAGTTTFLKDQIIGWIPLVTRHKAGLVLCPESVFDGQLLGSANLPRGLLFSGPHGRAVLGFAGDLDVVQLPLP